MRIKLDLRVFTIAAGMAVAICSLGAQTSTQSQQQATVPTGGSTNAQNGSIGDTMGDAQSRQMDQRFLGQVTQASLLNIAMGKLAQEKSSVQAVKVFGNRMVTDHERGLEIFKKVAVRDGVTVSYDMDARHKERLDKLAKLSGEEFDRAYVKDQLKAHQRMVSYFQSESDNATESVAVKMANNMLPAVQRHLNEIKELNKSLGMVATVR
jgi:putative membrane protein